MPPPPPSPPSLPTPPHPLLYHLVQLPLWRQASTSTPPLYFPPTYAEDGFTHLTADASLLLGVANQFYRAVDAAIEWRVLVLDAAKLAASGAGEVKYEAAAPVGTIAAREGDAGLLYPHLYGGIPAGGGGDGGGVVLAELSVVRAPGEGGEFWSIAGLEQWAGAAAK